MKALIISQDEAGQLRIAPSIQLDGITIDLRGLFGDANLPYEEFTEAEIQTILMQAADEIRRELQARANIREQIKFAQANQSRIITQR